MRPAVMIRLLAAAPFALGAVAAAAQDLRELARTTRDSVVLLNVYEASGRQLGAGTGFFVDADRVVTNFHVIDRAARIEAVLADDDALEVDAVLAVDEDNDLAILRVDAGGRVAPLKLVDDDLVEAGEPVVVLGNPQGFSGSLSEGIVSAVRTEGLAGDRERGALTPKKASPPVLQISAPISPGSSGSPVMNLEGRVLGVAVSQSVLGQNLNFAVPAAAVRQLLQAADQLAESGRLEKDLRSRPVLSGSYAVNVLISLLLFAAVLIGFRYLR